MLMSKLVCLMQAHALHMKADAKLAFPVPLSAINTEMSFILKGLWQRYAIIEAE